MRWRKLKEFIRSYGDRYLWNIRSIFGIGTEEKKMVALAHKAKLTSSEMSAVLEDLRKNGSVSEEQALISPARKKTPTKRSKGRIFFSNAKKDQHKEKEIIQEQAFTSPARKRTPSKTKNGTSFSNSATKPEKPGTAKINVRKSLQTSPIRADGSGQEMSVSAYRERRKAAKRAANRSRRERLERERKDLAQEEERLRSRQNAAIENEEATQARKRAQQRSARKRGQLFTIMILINKYMS